MAVRQRFKPAEREVFVVDARVEWLHGSHWRPATVTGEITKSSTGSWYVPLRDAGKTTRTISSGETVWGHPGGVRLPAPPSDA